MSKLLKAVAARHRPLIAAKMTPENGYKESKHLTASHLHKAAIIDKIEKSNLDLIQHAGKPALQNTP